MDIPTRHAETRWGQLYASTPETGRVRFSTEPPAPRHPVQPLTIHRRQYACHVEVSLTEPKGRGRVYVDDIWHFSPDEAITNLRRHPDGGPPTMTAQAALQREVVPELVEWLHTPDGLSLLQESSRYQQALRADRHAEIERLLQDALDRVRQLTEPVGAGLSLDSADEDFLHYLATDFRNAVAKYTTTDPPSHAASDRELNSYNARCRLAATAQGLDPIIDRLTAEAIPHSVEQTGGWVMVIEVPAADDTTIGVTADAVQPGHWVVARYADPEDEGTPLIPEEGFELPADRAVAAIQRHVSGSTPQQPISSLHQRLDAPPNTEPPGLGH